MSDTAGSTHLLLRSPPPSMATKYELPEKINEKRLRTLGKEVEMKTFKTNVVPEEPRKTFKTTQTTFASEEKNSHGGGFPLVKIICVSDCHDGVETIGAFIRNYLQVSVQTGYQPLKTHARRFYFKTLKFQRNDTGRSFSIKLHLQILEKDENLKMGAIYSKFRVGVLIFWETRNPSSLDEAIKWRQNNKEFLQSIPCVLVTNNTAQSDRESLQWIGPGKAFESETSLNQFCKDHGFVDHFEIKSRDWESGENSVFGNAVNCLLVRIF